MEEKNNYLVTYKFLDLTGEELKRLIEEITGEIGIMPLRVEKEEK